MQNSEADDFQGLVSCQMSITALVSIVSVLVRVRGRAPVVQRIEHSPSKRGVEGSNPSRRARLGPVAQWLEQPPHKRSVLGSSPSGSTKRKNIWKTMSLKGMPTLIQ